MEGIFIRGQSGNEIIYCKNLFLEPFNDRNGTYAVIEKKEDSEIILGEYSKKQADEVFKGIWHNIADQISVYNMPSWRDS